MLENVHYGPVCYRTLNQETPWSLEAYEAVGGYSAWRRILQEKIPPKDIIEEVKISCLRGRGGGGFPAGIKWGFVPQDVEGPKYLVCNSDEGEPGTSKDHWIIMYNPHQLLEGMLIASYAMGMSCCYHYLRGEFQLAYERCETALEEAKAKHLVGKNILGTDLSIDVFNILGAGAYIVGEETAMLESLEGKRGQPRSKPPFPAVSGLYQKPTTVTNTETLASVPVIMERGGAWFKALGTEQSGGTKLFSVSGHVAKPGVFEIPMGTPFTELLAMAGGMRDGRALKAVIPGGSSMRVVPAEQMMGAKMSYEGMQAVGSSIGSGGMIVMDDQTCMVEALHNMMHFYAHESCGKCTPCREGSGWVLKLLERMMNGSAEASDLEELKRVVLQIEGRTICAFGEAISWPVTSFIEHFEEEFIYYIQHHQSMVKQ